MHLVKEGLHNEILLRLEADDISPDSETWYAGYMMGLLQANLLTQEEHDQLLLEMTEMFEAYYRRPWI